MPPQQHPRPFGPTAADVLDDVAEDLNAVAATHEREGDKLAAGKLVSAALAERKAASALRNRANYWAERARLIRCHDEAVTVRQAAPCAPWWRRLAAWLRVPFSS